jgi:hypothetical protein
MLSLSHPSVLQGATCYLNSLMQTLFHTRLFRMVVYQVPLPLDAILGKKNVVKSLQQVSQPIRCIVSALYSQKTPSSLPSPSPMVPANGMHRQSRRNTLCLHSFSRTSEVSTAYWVRC